MLSGFHPCVSSRLLWHLWRWGAGVSYTISSLNTWLLQRAHNSSSKNSAECTLPPSVPLGNLKPSPSLVSNCFLQVILISVIRVHNTCRAMLPCSHRAGLTARRRTADGWPMTGAQTRIQRWHFAYISRLDHPSYPAPCVTLIGKYMWCLH